MGPVLRKVAQTLVDYYEIYVNLILSINTTMTQEEKDRAFLAAVGEPKPGKLQMLLLFFLLLTANIGNSYGQYVINSIAGNGTTGWGGDGGPATAASLSNVAGLATDHHGNRYFSDVVNSTIRKIDTNGIITKIAGVVGTGTYGGDGGPATAARLNEVSGLMIDTAGNMYIADAANRRVRKIDATGIITTIAGNGSLGFAGDGGPATDATLYYPSALAMDAAGNIYLGDAGTRRIRKINTAGIITTIAGNGAIGFSGDGAPATNASFNYVAGLAFDAAGVLYIADRDNHRIRTIDGSGIINTVVGVAPPGVGGGYFGGDGGPASLAAISAPCGIVFDAAGNLYINDAGNLRVRKVDVAGIISSIAGDGTSTYTGDGCAATNTGFNNASSIAMDTHGNIYYGDDFSHRALRINPNNRPTFVAGYDRTITLCKNTPLLLDTLLAVMDSDAHQTEVWNVVTPPAHGSLTASYTTTSTGMLLTPTGMAYHPTTGYTGADSMTVAVTDCVHAADTITIHLNIANCELGAGTAHAECQLQLVPNPNEGRFTLNLMSATDEAASVVITDVMGRQLQTMQITTNRPTEIGLKAAPGMYFVVVQTGGGVWSERVMVGGR